jgi:hypothetical protein
MPGGVCVEIQRLPTPRWSEDFTAAVMVYHRTVALSGSDANGFPQLTKLEFVLDSEEFEVSDRAEFIGFIEALHNETIRKLAGGRM